ncbi:hypothetical protein [Pseudogemmobacter sonorensis]|uniref:hypothetical protein n=1 Tax=Pseudogemmobacter sonorensis TaxID=2989681 RepID=UPI0036B501F5
MFETHGTKAAQKGGDPVPPIQPSRSPQYPTTDRITLDGGRPRLRKTPATSRAVRRIPKSSKGHFVGELVFNRGNQPQRLGFGSKGEHDTALCLIYRPDFADLEEQLAALTFSRPNGKPSHHFFDFRLTQTSGRRICISVKPERIAERADYRAMFECVKRAAIGNICDAAITVTERHRDPVVLHNAKLFHAARDPQPEIDALIERGLRDCTGPTPICEFLAGIGLGGAGFFGMARAIRFGHAVLLGLEKITSNTLITAKAA